MKPAICCALALWITGLSAHLSAQNIIDRSTFINSKVFQTTIIKYQFDSQFGSDASNALKMLVGKWDAAGLDVPSVWDTSGIDGSVTISGGDDGFLYIKGNAKGYADTGREAGYTFNLDIPLARLSVNSMDDGKIRRSFNAACRLSVYSLDRKGRRDKEDDQETRQGVVTFWIYDTKYKNMLTIKGPKVGDLGFTFVSNR